METTTQKWTGAMLEQALRREHVHVRGRLKGSAGPIVTDSRKVTKGCIFLALKGEKFDGHDFAVRAAEEGAAALILEHSVGANVPEFIVRDTGEAYGTLACAWRSQFKIPLILVAGANGKTTTTQMIASILRRACGEAHMVATEGNFNNSVGVPMTLLRISASTQAAVVEAGISHPGEMAQLVSWIRPTVTVITNAQREHQEFLDGPEASARENGLAIVSLSTNGTAVLPAADPQLPTWLAYARARGCRVRTYATDGAAPADVNAALAGGDLEVTGPGGLAFRTLLRAQGRHVRHDAAAAVAATQAAGAGPDAIKMGLAAFRPVRGRSEMIPLTSGAMLVNDAYNANPDSVRAAIDLLADLPAPRTLVLGDMAETGALAREVHAEVGAYAASRGINVLLAYGDLAAEAAAAFGDGACAYPDIESLMAAASQACAHPGTVLVKASHSSGFGKVAHDLAEPPVSEQ